MERRQILLGSGAVLATVLAGCSETASEDGDDDGSTDTGTDDDAPRADDGDDTGRDDDDGNDRDDDSDDRGSDYDLDDVPGMEKEKVDLKKHDVDLKRIGRDGKTLYMDVVVKRKPKDHDETRDKLGKVGTEIGKGISDRKKFRDSIETIELSVYDEYDELVLALYIDVKWLIQFLEDEMSADELATKALATAE